MIEVRDLQFRYGGDGFCLRLPQLDVAAGESVAFVGPSGCGKTTLVHLIAGILRPERGRIHVLGHDLVRLSQAAVGGLRGRRIGLVFQQFELLDYLDVRDNILLPNLIGRGMPAAWRMHEKAAAVARDLGLADKLSRRPDQLAQGERQRVAICRALLNEPEILIADEPTGNLDPDTKDQIMALIWALVRARGCTFLMVTHDHGLLAPFARVVDCGELTGRAA